MMTLAALARAALVGLAMMAGTAAPSIAERWFEPRVAPSLGQPYPPGWGVPPHLGAPGGWPWSDRHVSPRYRPFDQGLPRGYAAPPPGDRYLPLACLERYRLGADVLRLFDADCLRRHHLRIDALPQRCAVALRTARAVVRVYDPACLREAGYRMAGA